MQMIQVPGAALLTSVSFFSASNKSYFPEPTKSILTVGAHNQAIAKSSFHDLQFKVQTGSRYLGRLHWLPSWPGSMSPGKCLLLDPCGD
jgi:hypothetical protein